MQQTALKVAVFSDAIFPYSLGGMQKHTTNLVRYFARKKVKVVLFCAFPNGIMPDLQQVFTPEELLWIECCNVLPVKTRRFPGHYVLESYFFSKNVYQQFCRYNPASFDFVYIQGFTGWYTLRKSKNIVTGVHFHGLEMYQKNFGWKSKFQQWMFRPFVKKNIKMATYALSLGKRLTEIIHAVDPGKPVMEIPVGIGADWVNMPLIEKNISGKIVFLFIARYERRKGLEEFISAINQSGFDRGKAEFHFIGNLPAPVINKLNTDVGATFHGAIHDEKEILRLMKTCHVLVCPSYSEGMPTVILEAMACSMAVLVTDVGAVNELVDAANGWIIEAGDVSGLAQTLEKIVNNPEELPSKARSSKEKIRTRFSWESVIELTIQKINQVKNNRV